jgi:predicted O-methyltransferase YrrM
VLRTRLQYASGHVTRSARQSMRWLINSREYTNFTYDLQPRNESHLAWWVAMVTGADASSCRDWLRELSDDEELRGAIGGAMREHRGERGFDDAVRYGRRAGWYACVRALGPATVVETGVEKGLGTMVLAAALRRNAAEGRPGRLVAIDVMPSAGALLRPPYDGVVQLVLQDSLQALLDVSEVDLFIHDSDHSAQHELNELEIIRTRLAPDGLVLSDNAHATDELAQFAESTGRQFLFFDERPHEHWYPGAGIGAAFRTR